MLVKDLPCSTGFRLKAFPPYDFSLTVHKPAGWSLLTPFEIFEDGALWTAMRSHSGKLFGLKLRSAGNVEKPEIFCEVFSHEKLSTEERKELSKTVTWILSLKEDIREFYALSEFDPINKNFGQRFVRNEENQKVGHVPQFDIGRDVADGSYQEKRPDDEPVD